MNELKPCPFCGGNAIISVVDRAKANGDGLVLKNLPVMFVLIGCTTPGCILHLDVPNRKGSLFFGFGSKEEAAEKWNRRQQPITQTVTLPLKKHRPDSWANMGEEIK